MSTPRFAIFYADGSIHEGGGGDDELIPVTLMVSRDWLAAPSMGVLFVAVEDPYVSRRVMRNGNYYFPTDSGDYGNGVEIAEFLAGKLPSVVKHGEYVSKERFVEILQAVKAYTRIPRNGPTEPDPFEGVE
jgi:hypothetical protein